jgi:hypothetical protein
MKRLKSGSTVTTPTESSLRLQKLFCAFAAGWYGPRRGFMEAFESYRQHDWISIGL